MNDHVSIAFGESRYEHSPQPSSGSSDENDSPAIEGLPKGGP